MCKVAACVSKLTTPECKSLLLVGTGPTREPVPFKHSLKLIDLGLVEVNCGRVALTPAGNRALRMVTDRARPARA